MMLRLFFVVLLGLVSTTVYADTRVAAVNINKLMERAPQAQSASESIKSRFSNREELLLQQRDEIRKLEDRYKRDRAVLSSAELERLKNNIKDSLRDYKRETDKFNEDFSLVRNELLNKLQDDVYNAIVQVAETENYDLVVSESVLYASKRVDITDKVLDRLRSLYQSER